MHFFSCCFWWFLLGLLVGWLLNWLFWRFTRKSPPAPTAFRSATPTSPPPAAQPKPAPIPVAPAPVAPVVVTPPAPPAPPAAVMPAAVTPALPVVDLAAAAAAGFRLRSADDLAIVEGIGPKIAELLNAHGIHTFAELAHTRVERLAAILHEAGPHFHMANPGTWPEQARLAAHNHWAELKTLQDALDGGVPRDGNGHKA